MTRFCKVAFVSGAGFLMTAAALAQTPLTGAAAINAAEPPGLGTISAPQRGADAPKLANNAAAAALYKGIKTQGEAAPDPKRPAGGNTNTAHAIGDFVPVTDAMLRSPDAADWMVMRGNYQGWGFSRLDQIDRSNVKGLRLVWSRLMSLGINQSTPLVYKGVMFLSNPNDVIQAIDAATGEILWQYRRRLPSLEAMHNNNWGQRKRSVALYDDKLYTITRDNFLVALDARTGKELWQVDRGGDYWATNTTGPLVADGIVLAGANCQNAPFGCYVDAHDAETGKLLWRNDVIPHPGEAGDETWGKKPFNERWATGVWGTLTYDPDVDLLYYGSSGVTPGSELQRDQVGATLLGSDTRFAVSPKTGKVIWKHQVLPNDNWDQDCTYEMMTITTPVHPDPKAQGMFSVGRGAAAASRKTLTGIPCKTGIMWSFDALTGEYLWSKATAVQDLVAKIDDKGQVTVNPAMRMTDYTKMYHICPSYNGGRDWPFSAYSPETNVMYVPMQNICSNRKVRTDNIPSLPTNQYNTSGSDAIADGKSDIGRIDAINVETGRTVWSWEAPTSNYDPILATAGGLLFNGGMDRYLRAQDQADGRVVWRARLGTQVSGAPVSYRVGGRQYIAVATGGGFNGGEAVMKSDVDQPSGANMVYVFALPQ